MEKKNEKDGKPALPGDIIKVRKHHKQAYKFLSSALELDENEDPVISDMRKATGLYDKGAHELKEGIGVKLYGSGSEYDRARGLQEKMDGNLKHAESRILDLNLLIEKSLLEKQDGEENDKDSDTKSNHVKPTTSYKTPTYKKTTAGSSSSSKGRTGTKPNGSVPSSFAPKKAPFRPGGIAGASRNPGKSKGPKEPSADQHKKVSNLNNVDSKHANLILNEVIEKGRGVSFEDIGGMENAKQTLHEIVILPALRPELFTGLRAPARGLLLFGPPGNGKTLLAKAVATEANAVFFNISAASLTSKWIGEGEKMVRAMFSVARELQPAIIFIDEIDSLLSERKENENEATRRLKTEFLVGFDGVISESDERILVMGATNRPWELDDAALRRLVKRVHIPLPNYETRKDILKKVLSKHTNVSLDENDMNIIGRKTESYSGSDLTALCREAALMPIRNMSPDQIKSVPADQVRGLILNDLIEAMHTIRASVSGEYLKSFDEWNKKYGCVS